MNFLYLLEPVIPTLTVSAITLLLLVFGLLWYGALADRTVFEGGGLVRSAQFSHVDALTAGVLVLFFGSYVFLAVTSPGQGKEQEDVLPTASQMISGIVFVDLIFLVLVGGILFSLKSRAVSLRECFGLDRVNAGGAVLRGALLIALAFPLITTALVLSQVLLAAGGYVDDTPQEAVRFLGSNKSFVAQVVVSISAVVLAPFQEELIFRGYIYGVVRRYAGVGVGAIFNALLFAAIHMHLPSFGGLFVLAICLTLAYEWTGSIVVPMIMHALFNAITVVNLWYGGPLN